MKYLLTTIIAASVILACPVMAKTAKTITNCGDATASNKKARNWYTSYLPNNDDQYRSFINSSPWCSIKHTKGDLLHHNSILHYSSRGVPRQVMVYKANQLPWIKSSRSKIHKMCGVPRAWTKRDLPYRAGRTSPANGAKKCTVAVVYPVHGYPMLHQWGKTKRGEKKPRVQRHGAKRGGFGGIGRRR